MRAIDEGYDRAVSLHLRAFFYVPTQHSEQLIHQDRSVKLFEELETDGCEDARWAGLHRDIIVRFGRFPHRNRCLGRVTMPEEAAFLEGGGFAG